MSVSPRLNRLFSPEGKCFAVAMDHGVSNEPSYLPGIEDLKKVVVKVAAAEPDALLLGLGQSCLLQDLPGKQKPSLIVRADPTNFYGIPTPAHVFAELTERVVELALRLDAASVVVNILWAPDQPALYHQCVRNVGKLKVQCERFGMPLMVEPLPMLRGKKGGYGPHPEARRNVALVRQAVELGADIVKAEPTVRLEEFHKVVEAASGKPVLPRGGTRVSDKEILTRTYSLMQQGAAGIVYGRNVYQHSHPQRITRACKAIVHHRATVTAAMAMLREA